MAERGTSAWRRALVWGSGGFVALVLAVVVAWQAGMLNGVALWAVGAATGYRVSCGSLTGGLLSRFTCRDLDIADAKGRFLHASRFSLDWNPWALIDNKVVLKRVTLADATVTRLPKSQSTSTSNTVLPGTTIDVGALQATRIVLAMADTPRACVSLGGKAAIGPAGFDADLALNRCAPENGQFTFRGRYDKKSGALTLSAQGRDNGALVAALTGVKAAGPTDVVLTGDGTLSAFNGHVGIHAQHVASLDLAFAARDMTATNLKGRFDIAPALLPSWAPREPGTLSGDVTRGPQGAIDVGSLALDWDGVAGKGQVTLAANGALTGHVVLDTRRGFTISGLSIGKLEADAKIGGRQSAPALHGTLTMSNIVRGGAQIASLQTRFAVARGAGGGLNANLVGEARDAALPAPAGGLLGSAFSFHATAARISTGAMTLDATLNGMAATMIAKAEMTDTRGHGRLTLTVPDLAKAHAGFAGSAIATIDLPALALNGALDGTLVAHGRNITATGAGAALGPAPSLSAHLHAANGGYVLSDLKLETAATAAIGSASLARSGRLQADIHTTRGALKPLSEFLGRKLAGGFSVSAKVSGTKASPVVALAVRAPRMRIDNNIVHGAAATFDARKQGQWAARLVMQAKTPGGVVDLAANAQTMAGGWTLRIAKGRLGPATLDGQLAKNAGQYRGVLTLKGRLLEPVGFFAGMPMEGTGTLRFSGTGKVTRLVADITHIDAGPLKDASLRADARMEGLSGPLTATLNLKDGANHFAAAAQARFGPLSVTLDTFKGAWAGAPFALAAPTRFTMTGGIFTLDTTRLTVAQGTLALAAHGGASSLSASAHLADLPAGPLARLMGLGKAKGTIGLDFTAAIAPERTQAQLQMAAKDLLFSGAGKTDKPANVALDAKWDGHRLALDGHMTGLDKKEATLTAQIPVVRRTGSYMPKLASSGPVSAALRAQLQAARLLALLPVSEQSASGLLSASADVSGDIAAPHFSGRIGLADGSFTDYESGTKLENLNVSIDATGGSIAVLKLTATDGKSGTVKADGQFSMSALETGSVGRLAGHVDVTLKDAEIVRMDLVHASASGTIALDLPGDQPPKITGKLRTHTVRVDLGAAIPPNVPEIDVREINGGPQPVSIVKAKPSPFSKTTLDVAITMPNRVYVTGHGTNSEWSGNLQVAGTLASPDVSGTLDLVRGQAELIGKSFTLDQGKVRIDNAIAGGASVHIVGQNDSSDTTVTVTIDGPVTGPKISWSSSPSLPQSEILSRLFFGTSTPHLSIVQAFQLAQLSGQLNRFGLGSNAGGGILGFARQMTGLDVLNVETSNTLSGTGMGASAGAMVTAGKYVTDRVYVGVKQGTDVSAGTAQVQVKVTPHITLDAEAGANSQGSLGVSWKWDY